MTERQWRVCEDPRRMIIFIQDSKDRERQLRLFAM